MWTFLVSTAGPKWSSIQRPLYWLLALVLLLSGLGAWWIAVFLRKKWHTHIRPIATLRPIEEGAAKPPPTGRTRAANAGKYLGTILATAFIAGTIGWLWRDHQLASRIVPYTHVEIVGKINDFRYLVRPARMKTLDVDLCPPIKVDWIPGDPLKGNLSDWVFEQRDKCKRTISYHYEGVANATRL